MFCMKCGKELPDEAQFCLYCGNPVGQLPNPTTVNNKMVSTGEVNRDALKVHVNDLLILEYAVIALNQKKKLLEEKCNNNMMVKVCDDFPFAFGYDGQEVYVCAGFVPKNFPNNYSFLIPMQSKESPYNSSYWDGKNYLVKSRNGDGKLCVENIKYYTMDRMKGDLTKGSAYSLFERPGEFMKSNTGVVKKAFKKDYTEFNATKRSQYDIFVKEKEAIKDSIEAIEKEIHKTESLLQDTYSVNLIPSTFRNVYAINYLNDFLNTSNESFSNILLHYNLETIKQKLDKVIVQQSIAIVQNAISIAQNQTIISQNNTIIGQNNDLLIKSEEMLNTLSRIETNTELAATYGKITAKNTELLAWLKYMDMTVFDVS